MKIIITINTIVGLKLFFLLGIGGGDWITRVSGGNKSSAEASDTVLIGVSVSIKRICSIVSDICHRNNDYRTARVSSPKVIFFGDIVISFFPVSIVPASQMEK